MADGSRLSTSSGMLRATPRVMWGALVSPWCSAWLGRPASARSCHSARTAASVSASSSSSTVCTRALLSSGS